MSKMLDDLQLRDIPPSGVMHRGRWRLTVLDLTFGGSEEAVELFRSYREELLTPVAKVDASVEGLPPVAQAALAAWRYDQLASDRANEFVLDELPEVVAKAFGLTPTKRDKTAYNQQVSLPGRQVYLLNHCDATIGCYGQMVAGHLQLTVFLLAV
jgi:hypothetical protein